MILAFDVKNKNAKFSRDCYSAALKQGLLLRPIGNTVYFMPPYTITEPEMDLMMQATLLAIQDSL
jgi:adenosylmethionine-8-amino-7-oxononanoate aminotransferase